MAESKPIKGSDIFDQSLEDKLKELIAYFDGLKSAGVDAAKQLNKEFSKNKLTTSDDIKNANKAIQDMSNTTKAYTSVLNEQNEIELQAAELRLANAKAQREEIKLKNDLTKETNKQTKAQSEQNNEYIKMRSRLNDVKKELKALEVTGKQNTDQYKQLRVEFKQLDKVVTDAEISVKEFQRNVGNYPNAKAELREINKQMQTLILNGEQGTEEFKKLNERAGHLKDAISDASDSVKVFANESKTAQARQAFGQIGDSLQNLDFKDAADKARTFANVVKTITFAEMLSGLKSLGSALLSMGQALLVNPLFLIGSTIATIGYAFYDYTQSVKLNTKAIK